MAQLTIVQGTDRDFALQYTTDGVTPSTQFLGTDTLTGRLWSGGNQPALATPVVTWIDAPTAQFQISFTAAQTAALDVGVYRLQALAARAGRSVVVFDGSITISEAPGSGAALSTYCVLADLQQWAAWIDDLARPEDMAGFLRQRAQARAVLDEAIVTRFKWSSISPAIGTPGYGAYSLFGGRDPFPSKWLRDQLAANTLIVTSLTREITAKLAIAEVCRRQLDPSYRHLARSFRFEADQLMKIYRAEIDLNASGQAAFVVNLGATDLR